MVMSMAVDLRMGTRGVRSIAMRGGLLSGWMISSPSVRNGFECAAVISKISTLPGVTTMLHSVGCKSCHFPESTHVKRDAIDFEACPDPGGTARYGVLEADCDGVMVSFGIVDTDEGGGDTFRNGLSWESPIGIKGVGTSSSSSSSDDSEVADASSSSETSSSLSLEDSVQVDGSYSCFRGDDDRLRVL